MSRLPERVHSFGRAMPEWYGEHGNKIVLDVGVGILNLHPPHAVGHIRLAVERKRGDHVPLSEADYVRIAADLIERTLRKNVPHRVTGTSLPDILWPPARVRACAESSFECGCAFDPTR